MPKHTLSPSVSAISSHVIPSTLRCVITREVRGLIWSFTNGQCWYCGGQTNPFEDFCVDHMLPLARGGSNEPENLVPCCRYCNQEKAELLLDDWRQNFALAAELDEEPWIHPSRVFWFERDPFWQQRRWEQLRAYRRVKARGDRWF